jgi:hypothetical protein
MRKQRQKKLQRYSPDWQAIALIATKRNDSLTKEKKNEK